MGKDSEFYKGKKKAQTIRLRELLIQLPPCAVDYIHSKEVTSQVSTLVQYSYDLITFFTAFNFYLFSILFHLLRSSPLSQVLSILVENVSLLLL